MTLPTPQNVAVLGSTGSIGRATLEVIAGLPSGFQLHSIAAHQSLDLLRQQIQTHSPRHAILTNSRLAEEAAWGAQSGKTHYHSGESALETIARDPEVDILVAAIVGSAGLASCLAAAESGKRLALANKEALVVAGPLMIEAVARGKAELLPIDSEHSAIFQAIQSGQGQHQVRRIVLTASGGSLRHWPKERLPHATPDEALAHPTWQMGRKITIDSATMMNKALEIIEARWLFGIEVERIAVVIHPQSIIHSMVEFIDGSVIAQLSPPDMRLPIQYALTYPARLPCPAAPMDWSQALALDWSPVDLDRYPAIGLGFEVARRGGTCGAVLNAANEVAVERFLSGTLRFTEIVQACRQVLENHTYDPSPNLATLLQRDAWARHEMAHWST